MRGWWLSCGICVSTIVFSDVKLSFKAGFHQQPLPPAAQQQTGCRAPPSQQGPLSCCEYLQEHLSSSVGTHLVECSREPSEQSRTLLFQTTIFVFSFEVFPPFVSCPHICPSAPGFGYTYITKTLMCLCLGGVVVAKGAGRRLT